MDLSQKRLNQVLAWGTGLITVFITPWFSYDPLNVSRMALLLVVASIVALLLASNVRDFWSAPRRVATALTVLFVLQLLLVWIFAPANKIQQVLIDDEYLEKLHEFDKDRGNDLLISYFCTIGMDEDDIMHNIMNIKEIEMQDSGLN